MPRTHSIEPLSQRFENVTIGNEFDEKTANGESNGTEFDFKRPLKRDQGLSTPNLDSLGRVFKAKKLTPFASRLPEMNFSFESILPFPSPVRKAKRKAVKVKSNAPTSGYNSMDSNMLFKEILETVSRISCSLDKQMSNSDEDSTVHESLNSNKKLNEVQNLGSFINSLESLSQTVTGEENINKKTRPLPEGESIDIINNHSFHLPAADSCVYNNFLEPGVQILSSTPKMISIIDEEEEEGSNNIFALTPFERHRAAMQRTSTKPTKNSIWSYVAKRSTKAKKRKLIIDAEKIMAEQCAKYSEVNNKMEESLETMNQGIQLIASVFEELSEHLRSFQNELSTRSKSPDLKKKESSSF